MLCGRLAETHPPGIRHLLLYVHEIPEGGTAAGYTGADAQTTRFVRRIEIIAIFALDRYSYIFLGKVQVDS